jgi:hypothetical protein
MIYQGSAKYPVNEIVVHCTATGSGFLSKETSERRVEAIRSMHVNERGWNDIGYHWLIDRDGTTLPGRKETVVGAGVMGHNRGVIHISLFGGWGSAETDFFADHFTKEQDVALRKLIGEIRERTKIKRISGHNEYAPKACPGFNVSKWIKGK